VQISPLEEQAEENSVGRESYQSVASLRSSVSSEYAHTSLCIHQSDIDLHFSKIVNMFTLQLAHQTCKEIGIDSDMIKCLEKALDDCLT